MGLPVWSTINYGQGPRAGSTSPRLANAEPTALRRSPIRRRPRVTTRVATAEENNADGSTGETRTFRRPQNPSPTWRREYIRRMAEQAREATASDHSSGSQPQLPPALAAQFTRALECIDLAIEQASRIEAAYTSRPPETTFVQETALVAALRRSANFRHDATAHRRRVSGYERAALRGELSVHPTTTAMTVREVVSEMRDIEGRVFRELERVQQAFLAIGGIARVVMDMAQAENDNPASSTRRDALASFTSEAGAGSNGNWPLRENSSLSLNASLSDNVASLAERYPPTLFNPLRSRSPIISPINAPLPSSRSALLRDLSSSSRALARQRESESLPPPSSLLESGQTESEGLGDRNRSPSPMSHVGNDGATRTVVEGEQSPSLDNPTNQPQNDPRAWDSLLATVAPDDVLPSADSTFTAATASFEAGSSSGILQRPGARSGTTTASASGPGSGISSRSSWSTQITAASSNSTDENEEEDEEECIEQELQERLSRYPINPYYRPSDRLRNRRERHAPLVSTRSFGDDSSSSSSSSSPFATTRSRRHQRSALGASASQSQVEPSHRIYSASETRFIEADIRDLNRSSSLSQNPPESDSQTTAENQLNGNLQSIGLAMDLLHHDADDLGLSDVDERIAWMMNEARYNLGRRMSRDSIRARDRAMNDVAERLRLSASSWLSRRTSAGAGLLPRRRTTEMEGSAPYRRPAREERLVMERVESPGPMSETERDGLNDVDVDMDDVEMRMVVDGDDDELVIGQILAPRRISRRSQRASAASLGDMPGMPWIGQNPLLQPSATLATGTPSVMDAAALRLPSVLDIEEPAPMSAVREEITRQREGGDERR